MLAWQQPMQMKHAGVAHLCFTMVCRCSVCHPWGINVSNNRQDQKYSQGSSNLYGSTPNCCVGGKAKFRFSSCASVPASRCQIRSRTPWWTWLRKFVSVCLWTWWEVWHGRAIVPEVAQPFCKEIFFEPSIASIHKSLCCPLRTLRSRLAWTGRVVLRGFWAVLFARVFMGKLDCFALSCGRNFWNLGLLVVAFGRSILVLVLGPNAVPFLGLILVPYFTRAFKWFI